MLFHIGLYFSTSNRTLLLLSIILLLALYQHLKKLPLSIFYVFIIALPFAKGKGIDIMLLEKEYIEKNPLFDITYLFPIYLSTFYLLLLYLAFIRKRIFSGGKRIVLSHPTKMGIGFLLLFILSTASKSLGNVFEVPIFLSSLQIVVMLATFLSPFLALSAKKNLDNLFMIIASSTLFQSCWLILQTINKGYLHKDIEVYLFSADFVATSSENADLLRLPGTFFESSILGTFLLSNTAILLFIVLRNTVRNRLVSRVVQISLIASFAALILTGSRAIYLLFFLLILGILHTQGLLQMATIFTFIKKSIADKKIIVVTLLFLVLTGPYFFLRLSSFNRLFTPHGSGTYRLQLNEFALRLTSKNPLFGVGLNMSPYYFATEFPQEDYFVDPAHPHNLIAQLLAETGVIGTAFFLLFIYMIFRPVIQNKGKSLNEFHVAAITFFLCAQVYPIFINHNEIISYLFLYLGLAAKKEQDG